MHATTGLFYDAAMKLVRLKCLQLDATPDRGVVCECAYLSALPTWSRDVLLLSPRPDTVCAFFSTTACVRVRGWWYVLSQPPPPSLLRCAAPQYLNPMDFQYYTYSDTAKSFVLYIPPPPEGDPPAGASAASYYAAAAAHEQWVADSAAQQRVGSGALCVCGGWGGFGEGSEDFRIDGPRLPLLRGSVS